MSRRTVTSKTTIITSNSNHDKSSFMDALDGLWVQEEDFEKRPKTDYTYARSATYSNKYANGGVLSPNLSRRRLYAGEIARDDQSQSDLLKRTNTSTTTSHVRVYGSRGTTGNLNNINNQQSQQQQMLTRSANKVSLNGTVQQNNNNNESIFSSDEESISMSRTSNQRRVGIKRGRGRQRSPARITRSTGSTRNRSEGYNEDINSEISFSIGGSEDSRKTNSYALSSGLDHDELVTERSSTVIDTVSTGTPILAKFMGCLLFVYGCICILVNRIWYSFGYPVYSTLQRYLLLDAWLLSRPFTHGLRRLLLTLLMLLLPVLLLVGGTCSLHAAGLVNVASCGPLTGVYYVSKQSDVRGLGLSTGLSTMLTNLFTWTEHRQTKQTVITTGNTASVDWGKVIDGKLTTLKTTMDLEFNAEISKQRQTNTDLETKYKSLAQDMEGLRLTLNSLDSILNDIKQLKIQVAALQDQMVTTAGYGDTIAKLQSDIQKLQIKLGEVHINQESGTESGILVYLYNEIHNLRNSINKQSAATPPPPPQPAQPCPGSSCVCETELGLKLRALHEQLSKELSDRNGAAATVFLSSDNSTGLSEKLVKKMIQDELDIFAADQTGMPDFALQSMGAQIVSTRCSQTYYQESGLMTYFGMPLYHLHKDPSVVIQPGVIPGECWCFHGTSGSLVIELADTVKFNSFSLEHISAKQSVTGDISSAPKDIEVYGLTSELDTEGKKIGQWRYERNGPRLQFFLVPDTSISGFHIVELRVLSNWGKPEFTCLYRFRVHGKLAP